MTDFDVDGCDYGWKDQQRALDPDSYRTFQGIVWTLIAGALFVGAVLIFT